MQYSLSRTQRLSHASEIEQVKRLGKRVKNGQLDVRIAPSPLSYARVGIIVPKYKHTIVRRNQLKRRLRDLARRYLLPALPSGDVLIRTFPSTYKLSFRDLEREILGIVTRLGEYTTTPFPTASVVPAPDGTPSTGTSSTG